MSTSKTVADRFTSLRNQFSASLKIALSAAALIFVVFSTISYFISLIVGPILFFSTTDGLAAVNQITSALPIGLFMFFEIPIQIRINLGVLFLAIWALFIVCMLFAWVDKGGFLVSVRGAVSKSISLAKTNFLFLMPLAASALVSATVIISQFQESAGVQTGSINFPTPNPYVILTQLSYAPLEEEVMFRISSIGLVVGLALLVMFRGDSRISGFKSKVKLLVLALLSPELAKSKMGYRNLKADGFPRGISPVEWILILLTAVAFGLAHFLAGSGWEVGKVSTAFLAGVVFGIVYVAYGAYAPILMHWFFNYYFEVLSDAETAYGGAFHLLSNLANVTTLVVGQIVLLVFLLLSAVRLGSYLAMKASGTVGKSQPPS